MDFFYIFNYFGLTPFSESYLGWLENVSKLNSTFCKMGTVPEVMLYTSTGGYYVFGMNK